MDKIYIKDLHLRCIIGINDYERDRKQDIVINLTLELDVTRAGQSDALEDTVDYKTIKNNIVERVEKSEFNLVERLAEEVAQICLSDNRVRKTHVRIDKPGALRFARSVAVEISRPK